MANQTGRPIAPARKLVAAVMGTIAVFVMALGLGMSSWGVVIFGLAVLALSIALGMVNVVRRGARAWVAGSAEVKSISPRPTSSSVYGRAEIQAVVVAPGLPTSEVTIREPRVPVVKWPTVGDTLPITVDVDDMRRVRINWDDANPRERGEDPPPPAPTPYDEVSEEIDDDLLGDVDPPPWASGDRGWRGGDEPPPPPPPGTPYVLDTPSGRVVEGEFVDHDEAPPPLPRRAPASSAPPPPPPPPASAPPPPASPPASTPPSTAAPRPAGTRPSPRPRGGVATATAEPETADQMGAYSAPAEPFTDPRAEQTPQAQATTKTQTATARTAAPPVEIPEAETPPAETPSTAAPQAETRQARTPQTETAATWTRQAATPQAATRQAETPQAATPQAATRQAAAPQAATRQAAAPQAATPAQRPPHHDDALPIDIPLDDPPLDDAPEHAAPTTGPWAAAPEASPPQATAAQTMPGKSTAMPPTPSPPRATQSSGAPSTATQSSGAPSTATQSSGAPSTATQSTAVPAPPTPSTGAQSTGARSAPVETTGAATSGTADTPAEAPPRPSPQRYRRPEPTATSTTATPAPAMSFPTAPPPMTPPPAAPQPSAQRPASPPPGRQDDIDLPLDGDPDPAPETTAAAAEALSEGLIAPPAETTPAAALRPSTRFITNAAHEAETAPAATPLTAPTPSSQGHTVVDTPPPATHGGVVAGAAAAVGAVAAAAAAAIKKVDRTDKDDKSRPSESFTEPPPTAAAPAEPQPTAAPTEPQPTAAPTEHRPAAASAEPRPTGDTSPVAAVRAEPSPVQASPAPAGRADAGPWADLPGAAPPEDHLDDLITAYPSARPGPAGAIYGVGITVLVTDLARSIVFYRDTLGFYEIDNGDGSAVLASGDTRLVLRTVSGLSSEAGRLIYLNLEVGDIDAVYTELLNKGVTFVHAPRPVNRGDRLELWSATFRDPDDHNIAITQWRAIR